MTKKVKKVKKVVEKIAKIAKEPIKLKDPLHIEPPKVDMKQE